MSTPSRLLAAMVILGGTVANVMAHPISISSATIDVRPDSVAVRIEIMLEDLVLYHGLSADGENRFAADALNDAAGKHRDFLLRYLSVRDAEGERLKGRVAKVDADDIAEEGVLQSDLMSRTVKYDLQFPLAREQEFLTFLQTFGGEQAVLPAVMDLMLLQNGILIRRPVQLAHQQPFTVQFDWKHPPTQPPKGLAGLRQQQESRRKDALGIASYGGLYSFLYITPREVRHEVLIPLLSFEKWLPIDRRNAEFLEVAEQEAARGKIEEFFRSRDRNPITINGGLVSPVMSRLNFFGLDINDFAINAAPRRVSVYQARLGLILRYPSDERVEEVVAKWNTFHEHSPFLRTVVLVEDASPREHLFRVQSDGFRWQRDRSQKVNRLSPVRGPASMSQGAELAPLLERLLHNVYAAFDLREEGEIYDGLALTVTDTLLPELFLQIRRSLVMEEQGGAASRVNQVTVLEAAEEDRSGNEVRCRCIWRARGTVEHWGHVHQRTNEYAAVLTLQHEGGAYKLKGIRIEDAERVRFETKLRQ